MDREKDSLINKAKDNGVATAEIIPMLFLTLFYLFFIGGIR